MVVEVGVITRAVSMATDAAVVGFTLWRVYYIFGADEDVRAMSRITTTLAYNGNTPTLIDNQYH